MYRIGLNAVFNEKGAAAALTLMAALVAITPLCGLLFQCGCDWPWRGLDAGCNYYRTAAAHRCPWCVSLGGGILSSGLAVAVGLWAALVAPVRSLPALRAVLLRGVCGMLGFVLAASAAAVLAAAAQGYPLGVGVLLR